MRDVDVYGQERDRDMRDVNDEAGDAARLQLRQAFQPEQGQAGAADDETEGEQHEAEANGDTVRPFPGSEQVDAAEDQERQHAKRADGTVGEQHPKSERRGKQARRLVPVEEADRGQIRPGGAEHGKGRENDV